MGEATKGLETAGTSSTAQARELVPQISTPKADGDGYRKPGSEYACEPQLASGEKPLAEDLQEPRPGTPQDETAEQQKAGAGDTSENASDDTPKKPEPLRGLKFYSVMAGLVFSVFLVQLNAEIVATAIPSITDYFHSIADVGYYGSAYMLANCTLQPLAGRIYTHQSLKGAFLCFIFVFELGNLICGLATSSGMLIGGRVVAGAGGAGIANGALSIIAHMAPIEKRPVLVSLVANVGRFGAIFGPLIGGVFSQEISWRWAFLINCPIGVVVMAAVFFIPLPEREDKQNIRHNVKDFLKALDLPGFAIFAPSVSMLLLALEWGGVSFPWNSSVIIGLFVGSGVTFLTFIAWEYRVGDKGLIPLSMLRIRTVWSGLLLQILQMGCLFLLAFYIPIWFQAAKQASPISSGLMSLPSLLSQMIVGLTVAWIVQRIGYVTPFALLGCVSTAVGSGLMTTWQPWTGPNLWIGYQILTGSGRGLAGQMSLLAIQYTVPKAIVSLGNSLLVFGGNLGAAIFVAIGQTTFVNLLQPAVADFAPGVDPQRVINAGATNLGSVLGPGVDPFRIVLAYNRALTQMFYVAAGASASSIFFCLGLGVVNIKKKKPGDEETRVGGQEKKAGAWGATKTKEVRKEKA